MQFSNIEVDESKYPETGYILAYTRERIIFQKYNSREQVKSVLEGSDILELHLFDENKEYRLLVTESKRYSAKGYIETVADFKDNEEDVYRQKTIIDFPCEVKGTLYVLNHIKYDNVGMAAIDNYRICIKEEKNA